MLSLHCCLITLTAALITACDVSTDGVDETRANVFYDDEHEELGCGGEYEDFDDFFTQPDHSSSLMITWSATNISTQDSGWANHDIPGEPIEEATFVGCRGCDPYTGDMAKTENLRLLCFIPSDIQEPSAWAETQQARWDAREEYPAIDNWRYYYRWSEGYVGLTRPVETLKKEGIIGSIPLEGSDVGDAACRAELGDSNAKLMEFHDSGGAWNLAGMIHPSTHARELLSEEAGEERFIVWINDQQSNPWN